MEIDNRSFSEASVLGTGRDEDPFQQLTMTASALTLCGYERSPEGMITFHIPRGMSLLQIFERANAECARLGIAPAVPRTEFAWWRENTEASAVRSSDQLFSVKGFIEKSCRRPRREGKRGRDQATLLARQHLTFAPIEGAALENVLVHIATHGRVDSFNKKFIRTDKSGFELSRYSDGIRVCLDCDYKASPDNGAAGSPRCRGTDLSVR